MDVATELDKLVYQRGRIDQMQWVVERLTTWVRQHRDAVELLPNEFRLFLSDLLVHGVVEAGHGTRSAPEVQSVA